ncbi:GyrI-like domain-containing protein [Pseudarthrobacter cellobiosi]|uniref:GyrI-like domain-containing protein n=1 Tax=Pseudarthrobacter cellobiosi TaxID=2953654 RepID=UPI00208EBBBE|nr:GyrI-like domain-containing protein [Pseudarthrobacter sp. HLT1-5]MCO4255802.1 GyrI-like domain-containing protein [Pseudarthrobacter sp. HLT1-5]
MDKYEVKKQFKDLYAPRARDFEVVSVPPLNYLMLDGQGNPGTAPAYTAALEALYSVSYAVKFASKHAGRDYVVGPLEGLWTASDPDDEAPTLRRLHNEYMPANGLGFAGLHHEIYLSDARWVAPEKLKTILRQPVRRL